MEIKVARRLKEVFLLTWLIFLVGCTGDDHQHRDHPLPPPIYVEPETAKALKEGNRHFKEGWWTGAEKKYRIAIQAFPSLAEAQYNLGLTLNKQGRFKESHVHFKRALKLEPRNPMYRNAPPFRRYGEVKVETEPEEEAIADSY